MKHIKTYKLFENVNNIIDDVNDILLELNDLGFRCSASSLDELPPGVMKNIPTGYKLVKTHDVIYVNFSKDRPGFEFDDIKEVYWRVLTYLTDNGYTEEDNSLENRLLNKEKEKKISGAGKLLHVVTSFTKPI